MVVLNYLQWKERERCATEKAIVGARRACFENMLLAVKDAGLTLPRTDAERNALEAIFRDIIHTAVEAVCNEQGLPDKVKRRLFQDMSHELFIEYDFDLSAAFDAEEARWSIHT